MEKIINIAVVAHVDAGKSTLVDALLDQNGVFDSHEDAPERVMDSNDLEKVTEIAKKMVTAWGMSDKMGAMTYGKSQEHVFMGRDFGTTRDFSEEIAADLDREIKKIIDERYNVAKSLLTENRDLLDAIAQELLEKETLDNNDVTNIIIKVKGEEFNDKL